MQRIRTIVDLRNASERGADAAQRPAGLTTVHVPLEDYDGAPEFWARWRETGLWATPLYYPAFLDRFPQRVAAAVTAVARAGPGGVLVHCGIGRDRTGLVAMLLLSLAGVGADEIAADHAASHERLRPLWPVLGQEDAEPRLVELLAARNTTAEESLRSTLATLDAEAYLRSAGVGADDIAAVRTRLRQAAGGV